MFADDTYLFLSHKSNDTIFANFLVRSNKLSLNVDKTKWLLFQKLPPRGALRKRCSENMQQIYRGILMPKCDFNKVAKQVAKLQSCKSHFGMGVFL